MLSLARAGNDSLGDTGQHWDSNPWLLACQNGVIDLKTGILRPGKPDDLIKTACPIKFTGLDAPALVWKKFLSSTFEENEALISYMARILGYGVTGLTTHHIHPILYGKGRNGKGVLLETIMILGDV